MPGSIISPLATDERVKDVSLDEDSLSVSLMDGRTITVPLAWYPKLLYASKKQRSNWQISAGGYGIHWTEIDEDLSTEGLLRGAPAPQRAFKQFPPQLVRVPVNSRTVKTIGYDACNSVVEVEYKTGSVYRYFEVPVQDYEKLKNAKSVGTYLNQIFKKKGFPYKRIAE